ncbi:hypothetical protein RIF29_24233 [Crotalaria pallida]|uniref:Secreted protein n=1 Tax=Crotalaria pallida TaxID=3830 RepID=A0AAN9EK58_CROPI
MPFCKITFSVFLHLSVPVATNWVVLRVQKEGCFFFFNSIPQTLNHSIQLNSRDFPSSSVDFSPPQISSDWGFL